MAGKHINTVKKATAGISSGDGKKATGSQRKKVSRASKAPKKEDLLSQLHKHKKEIQEMRFGMSQKGLQKGVSRRHLRRQIARAATQLTTLRKHGGARV